MIRSMSTVTSPGKAALLVVDMQGGALANTWNTETAVGNVAGLVDRARANEIPVVWVRHSSKVMPIGSADWQIVSELKPAPEESIVEKRYGDSFEDTDLADVLTELGVTDLVVCGAQSDACVISTLFGGFVRGYNVALVGDAHTTEDHSAYGAPPAPQVIEYLNNIWRYRSAPDRTASVITAESFPGQA